MEWIDISLWLVVVIFVFTGEIKSLSRAIFLMFIFLIRSINSLDGSKENLDFILISVGISILLIFLMSKVNNSNKRVD